MGHFDELCLKKHRKGNGRPRHEMGGTLLDLDSTDDLSTLDEGVSKMNEIRNEL